MNAPAPVVATFTEAVRESIQIESFIYHIIRKDVDEPDYNDQVSLSSEQKAFFENCIRSACDGTQFIFSDPDNNTCKSDCEVLLDDVPAQLKPISRRLAGRFFSAHNKSMSEGVFIVSVFSVLLNNVRHNLLAFLKVDYSTVYQQQVAQVNGEQIVSLTRVMDSLADSPRALQKWAVVDPASTFAWNVLALQRDTASAKKDTEVAISSYFKNFLQVTVRENASTLTKNTVSGVNEWAKGLPDLPEDMGRSDFKARAINYFENADSFNTDEFVNRVLGAYTSEGMTDAEKAEREQLKVAHEASLRDLLAEKGIAGQVFDARPDSIPKNSRTTTLKTSTGVKVSFQGTRKSNNIEVAQIGNEQVITIRTVQLDEA
ncbi:nucleoid-associated protein [Neptuniibacter marinus]|uniref:nucleoid-associated protein n=1 Tax=Neptuniibacter marinus TaxID=1806670 RepID=UPI0008297EC9|nr:nucleoid-associated protein [Neptuniibacter marinus]